MHGERQRRLAYPSLEELNLGCDVRRHLSSRLLAANVTIDNGEGVRLVALRAGGCEADKDLLGAVDVGYRGKVAAIVLGRPWLRALHGAEEGEVLHALSRSTSGSVSTAGLRTWSGKRWRMCKLLLLERGRIGVGDMR